MRALPVSWIHDFEATAMQKQAGKGAAIFTSASTKVAMTSGKLVPIPHLYSKNIFVLGKIMLYWNIYYCVALVGHSTDPIWFDADTTTSPKFFSQHVLV